MTEHAFVDVSNEHIRRGFSTSSAPPVHAAGNLEGASHTPSRAANATHTMSTRNYWIGVVSRAHVLLGVKGGFIQLNHGKKAPVQRLRAGDRLAMYSPRTEYPDGEPLQSFTAIGVVSTGEIYQVEMTPDFKPYRVNVKYTMCEEAPIKPLLERLSFIKNKTHWGAAFRFGQLKVPPADFRLIARAMGAEGAFD